jgi:type IV secretory pathway VirB10-like protein
MVDKMYLVSPEQFHAHQTSSSSNPYSEKLRDLENQLRQLLENTTLDEYQKMVLYNQLLVRYIKANKQDIDAKKIHLELPIGAIPDDDDAAKRMPPPPPPPPLPPNQPPLPLPPQPPVPAKPPRNQLTPEEIVATAPKRDKKKLASLMKNMQSVGLGWDDEGQLTLHGNSIDGSNAKVILQGHVSSSKRKRHAALQDIGYNYFTRQLADSSRVEYLRLPDTSEAREDTDAEPPWLSYY